MKKILLFSIALMSTISMFAQGNNGLIAHWSFNGNVNDVSGNGLNGTINGNVTPAPGYHGTASTAMSFDAAGGGVEVPYNTRLSMVDWSSCSFIKLKGYNPNLCQVIPIFTRAAPTGGSNDYYILLISDNSYDAVNNTSQLPCDIYTPTQERIQLSGRWGGVNFTDQQLLTTPIIDTGKWYCIGTSYYNDTLKLYLDGALLLASRLPSTFSSCQTPLHIGYGATVGGTGGGDGQIDGLIDDIRMYNRGLSAIEMQQYCDSMKMSPTAVPTVNTTQPEIIIAPNPAQNYVNVYFGNNDATGSVQLIDAVGRTMKQQPIQGQAVTFDINSLPIGPYILKAEVNGQIITRKVLKN